MTTVPKEQRESEPDTSRSAGFRPYVLWRRGALAVDELMAISPTATWSMISALEANKRSRVEAAEALADTLHAFVPKVEGRNRRTVLQLRRDLYNDRRLKERMVSFAETLLTPTDAAELRHWNEQREIAARDTDRMHETYKREIDAARRKLGEIAGNEEFLKGVQLSGQGLYRSVLEYVDSARGFGKHPRNKNARKTETTIVRFAYRMALRTTPFASFTEIGAQPWRSAPVRVVADATHHRVVRLNRGLLVWMASVLKSIEGADLLFSLRLNNTLVRGESVHAFTRGMDGDERSYWTERFVSLPHSKPIALVLNALRDGAVPRAEIFERLSQVGLPADRVNSFLDKLVETGVLHQDLNLPDQSRDYAREVANRLVQVGTPDALQCAEVFSSMAQLEATFGTASAEQRGRIMSDLYEQVENFTKICDVASPPALSESPVWENVGTRSASRCWDPDLLERNSKYVSRLQKIIPLFDDMVSQRLGMYRWFAERHGEDGRCDDLLAVYREFASQTPRQMAEVMQAERDPHAEEIVNLRGRFLRRLYKELEESDNGATLSVDERVFDESIEEFASWVPYWENAAYWLQLVPSSQDSPASIVVNNVTTGHGVYFSRFCELFEPSGHNDEWSLGDAVRRSICEQNPRQADLTVVFGINVNLHPNLSPLELVYPGAVPTTGIEALTIRDLGIEADPTTRRLRLYTRADGKPLDLVPLNFLFPAAAPMLYRFLCALGTSHNVRTRFWDRLRLTIAGHRDHFPQLRFGELVLERQSWFVSSQELAFLGDGTSLPGLKLLQEAEAWRRARGLPQESFIRGADRAAMVQPEENWADVTRHWALEARSARRKPQYLDFRNPFLLRILANVAQSSSDGGIFFSECLPPTSSYTGTTGATSAEEFFIEFSAQGRNKEQGR